MKEVSKLFAILLICFASTISAQESKIDTISQKDKISNIVLHNNPLDRLAYNSEESSPVSTVRYVQPPQKMPFFCHLEHNFARNSGIPVKFRVGNVQYVDKLERK